jgi:DNA-binding transcriptional ArsR family regulator
VSTYQGADSQLDALGDATRRAIVARLLAGPLPVVEIAREFPVSRPAISQHLRVLKHAHLVLDRPKGNQRVYELNPKGFDLLRDYFDQFWTLALAAFKDAVEARQPRNKARRKR